MPPTPEPFKLRRGINMGNMLEAPSEGAWGLRVREEYFDRVKKAGFDFVRLPVRWNAYADAAYPYSVDPAIFARVDEIVGWALARDLAIIIDFHHYEEMASNPRGHKERFLGIWRQLAEHYRDYPAGVLFEPLNEPHDQLDAELWNQYFVDALAVIRATNPTRDVIFGPVNWNNYGWMATLAVPDDTHLIATFHYYDPFQFTHQGAEWQAGSDAWLGMSWDATDEQKAEVGRHFDSVAHWAQEKNIRVLLGEFGAYSKAPQDARVRWTAFIREQAEARGWAWAYWEFASGFGAYDPVANVWREDLLRALMP